jgi:hypothetical protein
MVPKAHPDSLLLKLPKRAGHGFGRSLGGATDMLEANGARM